jgi:uncharacterized protein (TIGR03437 family)
LVRLSRHGALAWIEQTTECRGIGTMLPEPLQGLYAVPELRLVRPSGGARLANRRTGRRLITGSGEALTFAGAQLQLMSSGGTRVIRHERGAAEAVVDAEARNAVYTEPVTGRLRWIDLSRNTDEDLLDTPVAGTAAAISGDGQLLAFLSAAGRLQIYRRRTRTIEQPLEGIVCEFVLSDDGRVIYAVLDDGRLTRLDVVSGASRTVLEPMPEIDSSSSPLGRDPSVCPLWCYGQPEPTLTAGAGSLIVLYGRYLDRAGWRVRLAGMDLELHPLDESAAWFQVPTGVAPANRAEFTIFHPQHPVAFSGRANPAPRVVSCLGALHQAFDAPVTEDNPARIGEVVHVFLTGLRGTEPVPYGEPNPLRLIPVESPPAVAPHLETLFFGLAPGLTGMQQLDVRVTGPPEYPWTPAIGSGHGCAVPVVP